jgi:hypothetical protein
VLGPGASPALEGAIYPIYPGAEFDAWPLIPERECQRSSTCGGTSAPNTQRRIVVLGDLVAAYGPGAFTIPC